MWHQLLGIGFGVASLYGIWRLRTYEPKPQMKRHVPKVFF